MLEGIGKIKFAGGGKSGLIYVPSAVMIDSAFPLKSGEKVKISIKGSKLIIESAEETQ